MPGGEVGGEEQGRDRDRAWSARGAGQWTGWRTIRASSHRNGSASAIRQKPAEIGPTPEWRTRNGPPASARLPSSKASEGPADAPA